MFPQFPPTIFTPAIKAHFDNLITFHADMAQRTIETLQSLTELNMQFTRELIAEAGVNLQRMLASKDAGQLGSAVGAQLTPGGALQNYQRRLAELTSRANSTLAQTAANHIPSVRRSSGALAEEFLQRASEQTARASETMASYHAASQVRH